MSIHYVSKEKLAQMKEDLNILKTEGRAKIANAISEAREKGDLKENAEYDAAKEAQGLHEARIAQLESDITNSRILDKSTLDLSKVSILTTVTITNIKLKKQMKYQIVSETEANLKEGKISVSSPIGKGLLGKKIGDIAEVITPNGTIQFEINEIAST